MKNKVFILIIFVALCCMLAGCGTAPSGYVKNEDGLYEKYDEYTNKTIVSPANNFGYALPVEFDYYKGNSELESFVLITATKMDTFGILGGSAKSKIITKLGIYNSDGGKIEVPTQGYGDYDIGVIGISAGTASGITTSSNTAIVSVETARTIRDILKGAKPTVRFFYQGGTYEDTTLNNAQIKTALSLLNTL